MKTGERKKTLANIDRVENAEFLGVLKCHPHSPEQGNGGEVIRLSGVERFYTRPFLRSEPPLFQSVNAVWEHPNKTIAASKPLGMIRGLAWQDNYLRDNPNDQHRIMQFNTYAELIAAYEANIIGSLLGAQVSMHHLEEIEPIPRQGRIISTTHFHHYLCPKYKDFMVAFSNLLTQNNPFKAYE